MNDPSDRSPIESADAPPADPNQLTAEELKKRKDDVLDGYWANKQGLDLCAELHKRTQAFQTNVVNLPKFRRWLRGHTYYFGVPSSQNPWDATDVAPAGDDGEVVAMRDGTVANIGRHLVNLATGDKLAFKSRPLNSDFDSEAANQFVSGIVDYYMEHKGVDLLLRKDTENGVAYGESYICVEWDQTLGKPWKKNPLTGETLNEGDLAFSIIPPWNLVHDLYQDSPDFQWVIIARQVNKHDLAAKYAGNPDVDCIQNLSDQGWMRLNDRYFKQFTEPSQAESNYVTMFTFYHARSPACPDGRYAHFLDGNILLESGPLPYEEIPVYRMSPEVVTGTSMGSSPFHLVMGLQPLIDDAMSSLVSAMEAFSNPNIIAPEGSTMDKSMVGGYNFITVPPSNAPGWFEPKLLKFEFLNESAVKTVQMLVQSATVNSGVGETVRGEVQEGIKSGNALALLQAQAVQFATPIVAARTAQAKRVANAIVRILRKFAMSPRLITITGKDKLPYQRSFSQTSFANVDTVEVEEVNPVSKTIAGRQQLADNLLDKGLIKTLPQYFQVLSTGQVDSILKAPVSSLIKIQKENEMLRKGINPAVFPLQDHATHIQEHYADYAMLESALDLSKPEDAAVSKAFMDHMFTGHVQIWRQTPPDLLMALGFKPLPDGMQPLTPPPQDPQSAPPPPPPGPMGPPPGAPTGVAPMPHPLPGPAVPGTSGGMRPSPIANQLNPDVPPRPGQPAKMSGMPKVAGTNTPWHPGVKPNGQ